MVRVTKVELNRTITDIMEKGDLGQLTTKKIRILCEQKYKVDLTDRKDEIDKIVLAFIHKNFGVNKDRKVNTVKSGEGSSSSGSDDDSSCSSSCSGSGSECSYSGEESSEEETNNKRAIQSSTKPVPKKMKVPAKKPTVTASVSSVKKTKKVEKPRAKKPAAAAAAATSATKTSKESAAAKQLEMDDAALARQLQAEEWNFRQKTVKKLFRNIPQKKKDGNEIAKKRKATGFLKKCSLSPDLAELLGTTELSRPDIVQKMWSVVRERNLFDTSNKQYALCDEQLLKIFGKKRVRLIGMMRYLKHHVKDIVH